METIYSKRIVLNNGVEMPQIGFGVFLMENQQPIEDALASGYRAIDTAKRYENERLVGAAIQTSGIARDELFITSKVWDADQGYDETLQAYERSLAELKLDYLDLYMIHWPMKAHFNDTWRAMERLLSEKRVRAIGVCNYEQPLLERLIKEHDIIPAVNQVETHPYFAQTNLMAYLAAHHIQHEAWGPLGQNKSDVLQNDVLQKLARHHQKSPAQIIIRWHLQRGSVVIPKSQTKQRIQANISVADFELSSHEMRLINELNKNERVSHDPMIRYEQS
ncbi:aldo/keto reductase [Brochothrix campestris]|uniref:Aldo/keto reductase n=1 Tax=Brochothrix campestris FSL F6-1037 TaxID=1265861 RepID=W7CNV0_9LIST|nr:aldo/keto reductase [Brochothrix campestris]EUJ38355.1 aldo/keto reductase [Brochothrix campestris FSL F6-1037]